MKSTSVIYYTFIIRNQIEYSTEAQAVVLRCILETPTTGQRRGFANVDALLAALHAELIKLCNQMIPPEEEKRNSQHLLLHEPGAENIEDVTRSIPNARQG